MSTAASAASPLSPQHPRSATSLSRPSSRTATTRARTPSVTYNNTSGGTADRDSADPVALRAQISAIKHSMRQQHAQVSKLENELLQGPRPIPGGPLEPTPSLSASTSSNPSHNRSGSGGSVNGNAGSSRSPILNRRTSRDVLEELAGPDSSLPLPMSNMRFAASASSLHSNIQEGVPMEFKNGSTASLPSKRTPSPTRTLSRIPVSSVGNARALADEGSAPLPALDVFGSSSANTSLTLPPPSPNGGSYSPSGTSTANKRLTLTPGGTTKVLADLQTGVANARNALENTKQQLRLSQRQVASLTRQTEDLKEGRERLRLENEGLNNVVARKERLLQEAISRARKAEEERDALRTQLKTETSSSKKALRDTETALSEATALSQRRDREYITLRDSLRSLTDGFKSDHATLREEMRRREERVRKEADEMGKKYRALLEETRAAEEARAEVRRAGKEKEENAGRIREAWKEEIDAMKEEVARSSKESEEAVQLANSLSLELTRLRRLMQAAGRETSDPGLTS